MSNKQYIVLPGGKECKKVNPYEKPMFTGGAPKSAWHQFDETNPTYALTEAMPECEVFEGCEVWQILYGRTKWVTDVEKCFNTFLEFREYWFDRQTRIAIKPLKAIEPVKEFDYDHLPISKEDQQKIYWGKKK